MLSETLETGLQHYQIGPKIRALRQQKKLNLVTLGEHTGLSPGMLSKIERSDTADATQDRAGFQRRARAFLCRTGKYVKNRGRQEKRPLSPARSGRCFVTALFFRKSRLSGERSKAAGLLCPLPGHIDTDRPSQARRRGTHLRDQRTTRGHSRRGRCNFRRGRFDVFRLRQRPQLSAQRPSDLYCDRRRHAGLVRIRPVSLRARRRELRPA